MSLMDILSLMGKFEQPLEDLMNVILSSSNPREAIERAKRAVVADAADLATDAALDEALKRL